MEDRASSDTYLSLPDQIAGRLRAEFVNPGTPGTRLPTVVELACRYSVSKHTLTNALELLARKGLLTKRQGRGVFVAEQKTHCRIGILSEVNLLNRRISHHFRALTSALKMDLEHRGYEAHLYVGSAEPSPEPSESPTCPRFWSDALDGKLDGGVIVDVPSMPAWHRRVRACPVPLVGFMTPYTVSVDFDALIGAAVRNLAKQGCRRLGLLAWNRVQPFRRAVAECALCTSDAWIRADLNPGLAGSGWEEFREIWMTAGEKPDGMVILDDMLFYDAQLAMAELGVRVPEELRLVVQTNKGNAPPIRLPVTTIEFDPSEMAEALGDLLVKRLHGELGDQETRTMSFREHPADTHGYPAGPVVRPAAVAAFTRRSKARDERSAIEVST